MLRRSERAERGRPAPSLGRAAHRRRAHLRSTACGRPSERLPGGANDERPAGLKHQVALLVSSLVLDEGDVHFARRTLAFQNVGNSGGNVDPISGEDRPLVLKSLLGVQQALDADAQKLPQIGSRVKRGGKRRRRDDRRVPQSPRVFLVVIDRIVIAERFRESPDCPFLHLVQGGRGGAANRVFVEHGESYLPAGSSRTVRRPRSADVMRGAALTTRLAVARSPATPPFTSSSMDGSDSMEIASRGFSAPTAMVSSRRTFSCSP